jgi:hypothetical protein
MPAQLRTGPVCQCVHRPYLDGHSHYTQAQVLLEAPLCSVSNLVALTIVLSDPLSVAAGWYASVPFLAHDEWLTCHLDLLRALRCFLDVPHGKDWPQEFVRDWFYCRLNQLTSRDRLCYGVIMTLLSFTIITALYAVFVDRTVAIANPKPGQNAFIFMYVWPHACALLADTSTRFFFYARFAVRLRLVC